MQITCTRADARTVGPDYFGVCYLAFGFGSFDRACLEEFACC